MERDKLFIEINNFIKRRFPKDCDWMNGNCYWFARILTDRFPQLDIYYLPIRGHFVAGDGKIFYDWISAHTQYSLEEEPIKLSVIHTIDPLWYNRLVKDCIN